LVLGERAARAAGRGARGALRLHRSGPAALRGVVPPGAGSPERGAALSAAACALRGGGAPRARFDRRSVAGGPSPRELIRGLRGDCRRKATPRGAVSSFEPFRRRAPAGLLSNCRHSFPCKLFSISRAAVFAY